MNILTKQWPPVICILMGVLGGFLLTPHLPDHIPVHWGIDGTISTYAAKETGVYLNPAAMTIAYLFFTLIPYSDKRRVRDLRELGIYEPLRNTAVYTFGYAQLLTLGIGSGIFSEAANYIVGLACLLTALGVEAAKSGLLDSLKPYLPGYSQLSAETLQRAGLRTQIAAGIGFTGTLFAPYAILWFIIPLALVIVIEQVRKPT